MVKNLATTRHERLLTEVELEIMTQIWRLGKVTVKEVMSQLPANRNLAYTTVATVMKVLEQKGFLECQKDSYAHVFVPLVAKTNYEKTCVEHMVINVFDGETISLVKRLLDATSLDKKDIQKIKDVLKNLKQEVQWTLLCGRSSIHQL